METVPTVGIVMGSKSDLETMSEAGKVLESFGVSHELVISSAHRAPEKTARYAKTAHERGMKVIIAGAGYAAHLAGVIAAHTTLPIIGVPLPASSLQGLDSLLATCQMPSGIPVATVAIGATGAKNAAHLALQILATSDAELANKLQAYRTKLAATIEEQDHKLRSE